MSPAPVKATNDNILAAARAIAAHEGADSLSLNAVAEAVGVRAPSLYKRFANRARGSHDGGRTAVVRDARYNASLCLGGETGRHKGLKIPRLSSAVRVRFPSRAP